MLASPALYAGCLLVVVASLQRRARLAILSFMALTGIFILGALALLRTFKWA